MRGGVRRAQNAERAGLGIGENFQGCGRHHALEGFTGREFAGDRLGFDALHGGGRVGDFEAGLLRDALQHHHRRSRWQIETLPRRFSRRGQCGDQKCNDREQEPPPTRVQAAQRAGKSGRSLGAGHGACKNTSLPAETDEGRIHAKEFFAGRRRLRSLTGAATVGRSRFTARGGAQFRRRKNDRPSRPSCLRAGGRNPRRCRSGSRPRWGVHAGRGRR